MKDPFDILLGQDTPDPLPDILDRLADAVDHLLVHHDCDCHPMGYGGYEKWGSDAAMAREFASRLREALSRNRDGKRGRYTQWAGNITKDGMKWLGDSIRGRSTDKPAIESIWPITDDLACGPVDGRPVPGQYLVVAFDPMVQTLVCDLLNRFASEREKE